MRIFLAGATGAIGRLLVPILLADGHDVTALTRRDPSSLRRQGVTAVVGDVYDAESLREVVAAARPDVVMHQLTDLGSRDFVANGRIRRVGTRNLVDAALAAGARRVISQSISWAYEGGDGPAVESTSLDLAAPDEARRGMVEAVAELENITAEAPEWVVLRYGMLYGPGTWYTKGGLMADTGRLPTGSDITSFLHVEDAAIAAVQALDWPTGAVNIVDNDPAPASAWSPAFAASVGATAPPIAATSRPTEPTPLTHVSQPTWARGASNTLARTRLAWTPIYPTWRTGFAS
ncbi:MULTISPECIES: NAD-dependent epimerase/dehydratase family protein [unclassified Kribbella]|uniref:NAD-dependent epimerase/dehydratase family protein n=1 Tax=unclassified Kribbella TaxID=2644121 RepID=UPI0030198C3A